MISVDGSYLESGGQILRTSVALSAITGKPCRIINIRKGRKNPGLQAQHLKGLEAAAKICNAEIKNAKIGSQEIEFVPKKIKGGHYSIDIGTAGSITLVLQTLILPTIHAEEDVVLEIIGGTDVPWSPTIEYFKHIFCDFIKKMGVDVYVETLRYGFYPKGGGKVRIIIKPCKELKAINLVERGKLTKLDGRSIASESLRGKNVAERQFEGAEKKLKLENKTATYAPTLSPGSSISLYAHYENCKLGGTALGEIGKPAEKVGEEAAENLIKQMNSNACLDEHMADQILPYIALAGGSVSVAEITNHCKTNMWVIEKLLPVKFQVKDRIISV